jgi:solute carrier family 50 protein (sugar transporter)
LLQNTKIGTNDDDDDWVNVSFDVCKTKMTVDVRGVIFDYACPFLGCLIASTLFAAPVNDLRSALRRRALGPLNPTPWAVLTGNCLGWCSYAYYTADPFILASNVPGLVLSLWLNVGASKLQYLAQAERDRTAPTRTVSTPTPPMPSMPDRPGDDLVFTPQEVLFLRVVTVWFVILVVVGWLGYLEGGDARRNVVGIFVNINMLCFYAAPLQTMRLVVETRCSDR